jgi:hypothetical protein
MIMETEPGRAGRNRALKVALYAVLLVLGVTQGLIGSFQYGQSPVPWVAVGLDALLLASCVLGGWGTGSFGGAMCVAAGWILTSFYLSMGTHEGSVIITNTAAGKWYLYGGTLSVLLAASVTFALLTRQRLASLPANGRGPLGR